MSEIQLDFQSQRPYSTKGILIVLGEDEAPPLYSDTLDIANAKKRTDFIEEVVQRCEGIKAEELEQAVLEKIARIMADKRQADEKTACDSGPDPLENTPAEVKTAAMDMLKSETLFERISADIAGIGVAGEENLALMLYVVMTSRLLDKPLSAIVQGASASGKSYIIETAARLMPSEAQLQAHDFSDQALYYLEHGSLVHKVVVSGERVHEHRSRDGYAEDNTKAFREMVASGELRKAVTIKGSDGKPKTAVIHQPGPIAYLESTTAANIHDEDSTRLLPLVTDESATQTGIIIEAQRREAKGQTVSQDRRQEIIERHHTLQRLLRPLAVRIPFIDSISLPATNIATRRTYQQFAYTMNSIAFLRQHQKEVKTDEMTGQEYIEADEIDYAISYGLMSTVLARKYSPMNQQSRDLLRIVSERADEPFTQKDCELWTGLSNTTVRRRLAPLVSAGVAAADTQTKPYKYRIANPDLAQAPDLNLPTPEDIAERVAIMSEESQEVVADE